MIERLFPSMFHRRLLLLAVIAALVLGALLLQLFRLTVVQGEEWRQRAEQVLASQRLIPTARGPILDRKGRVLAQDRPSYDVAVMYDVLSGDWAYRRAAREAKRQHRSQWPQLTAAEREERIGDMLPRFSAATEELWQSLCALGKLERSELERRKADILRRVEQIATDVWKRQADRREALMDDSSEPAADVRRPISEHLAAHAVLENVDEDTLLQVRRLIADAGQRAAARRTNATDSTLYDLEVWESVSVQPSRQRVYPHETIAVSIDLSTFPGPLRKLEKIDVEIEGAAWSILGDLRPIWKVDVDRRPYVMRASPAAGVAASAATDLGGYLPGDKTGRSGIEATMEDVLRGHRGRVVEYADESRPAQRSDPVMGRSVTLALDIHLQARIQAIMSPQLGLMRVQPWHSKEFSSLGEGAQDGEESHLDPLRPRLGESLNGAAVVIDIATGEVLAAVSMPTANSRMLRQSPDAVWGDQVNRPFINRAVAQPYQPGSTIKPLVLLAAITDGKLEPTGQINCHGHLFPNRPHEHRCWIYKQFNGLTHDQVIGHAPDGVHAIARSCNIFFFTLGQQFGPVRLLEWYSAFGLGRQPQCGLAEETPGHLPDLDGATGRRRPTTSDAIMMAIGQGPVEWTPLQAANAYATLGRGGYAMSPTLLRDIEGEPPPRRSRQDLRIDPRAIDVAMQGLFDATNRTYGTGHHFSLLEGKPLIFDCPGVKIFGKSGTATAPPLRAPFDDDGDGKPDRYGPPLRTGDHAWFIGLAQRQGSSVPNYAIAVIVEYGGSGGAVAAPVANQILYALKAEGYL